MFLFFAFLLLATDALEIRIENDLIEDLFNPHFYITAGGVSYCPELYRAGESGEIKFEESPNPIFSSGIMTIRTTTNGSRYAIAWKATTSGNQIGYYFGSETDHRLLMNAMFKNDGASLSIKEEQKLRDANKGWLDVVFEDGTMITGFMSSDHENPRIIAHFKNYQKILSGAYFIQNVQTGLFLYYPSAQIAGFPKGQRQDPWNSKRNGFIWLVNYTPLGYTLSVKGISGSYLKSYTFSENSNVKGICLDVTSQPIGNFLFDFIWQVGDSWSFRNLAYNMYYDAKSCWKGTATYGSCEPLNEFLLVTNVGDYSKWRLIRYIDHDLMY